MRLRVSMPVHPHFGDLAILRLTEDSAPCVHPLPGAAPAVCAAKLGGEPGSRGVDLSGLERHLGLGGGDVLPVGSDRIASDAALAEGSLEEDGVGGEDGDDRVHVPALPPAAKRLQQLTIHLTHGAQYSPIWNRRSGRMVHGRRRSSPPVGDLDRKSTRLNSSHVSISYAVFCLKKKNM